MYDFVYNDNFYLLNVFLEDVLKKSYFLVGIVVCFLYCMLDFFGMFYWKIEFFYL